MALSDNEAWLRFCHDVGDALYEGDDPNEEDDDGFWDGGVDGDEWGEADETDDNPEVE